MKIFNYLFRPQNLSRLSSLFSPTSSSLQEKHLLSDFELFSSSPINNLNSTKWLPSRCRSQSYLRHRHQSYPGFPCAPASVVSSFTLLKHDSLNAFSNWRGLHYCNIHRCSAGPSYSLRPAVEIGFKSEANMAPDPRTLPKWKQLSWKIVSEIVDILRNEGTDLDSRLCALASNLSIYSIIEVFEAINSRRIYGLRFYEWIWSHNFQLRKNAVICSLVIDNVGRFDDYETIYALLKKFRSENVCLTYKAFGFLQEMTPANSSLTESTERVVDLLNSVGGSIRNSGVFALVEMFCKLDLFEMARYVIKITESKESYYCVMIREKCGRGLIEDAYGMIEEMREACHTTNTSVYNYLLARLCKNDRVDEALRLLDEMTGIGMHPDAITYEIVISSLCKLGMMDALHELLNQMKFRGIKPRLATHTSVIKILFAAEKYESAYKYVVDSSTLFEASGNLVYGLLAKLYCEKGNIMSAQNTLDEMMEKNLKLDFSLYMKIVKLLRRSGRVDLARDLQRRQSRFVVKSRTFCQLDYQSS